MIDQEKMLRFLRDSEGADTCMVADRFGITLNAARKRLRKLQHAGLIKRIGVVRKGECGRVIMWGDTTSLKTYYCTDLFRFLGKPPTEINNARVVEERHATWTKQECKAWHQKE